MAAPIYGADRAVLGALVETIPKPPGLGGRLLDLLSWRNAALIVLVAAFVGALFGFLSARWLTRRLRLLATATDGWGRGDFTVLVSDRSGDELGELARRLDQTAGQVQELLQDREQLAVIEERNRLARDLHDSVTQAIYAVTLYAEASTRELLGGRVETALDNVRELRSSAEQALREMRLLVLELRPPELEKEGLAPALQKRLESVEERVGLSTELRVEPRRRSTRCRRNTRWPWPRRALNRRAGGCRSRNLPSRKKRISAGQRVTNVHQNLAR